MDIKAIRVYSNFDRLLEIQDLWRKNRFNVYIFMSFYNLLGKQLPLTSIANSRWRDGIIEIIVYKKRENVWLFLLLLSLAVL